MDIFLKVKLNNPNSKEYKKRAAYLARAREYAKNYAKQNREKIAAKNRRYQLAIKKTRNKDELLLLRQKTVFLIARLLEKKKERRFLRSYHQDLCRKKAKAEGRFNWEAARQWNREYRKRHRDQIRLREIQRRRRKLEYYKQYRNRPEIKVRQRELQKRWHSTHHKDRREYGENYRAFRKLFYFWFSWLFNIAQAYDL